MIMDHSLVSLSLNHLQQGLGFNVLSISLLYSQSNKLVGKGIKIIKHVMKRSEGPDYTNVT